MDRKQETKIVKDALVKAGYTGVKVGHGTGTAWGWLHIHVNQMESYAITDRGVIAIAQKITGRHGDYDGCINIYIDKGQTGLYSEPDRTTA